jgi:hypothetical protein
MLLLKQSLSLAQEPGLIVLNGPYVTLGERTLVGFRGNNDQTVIRFQLEPAPVLDCEVSFQSRLPDPVTTSNRSETYLKPFTMQLAALKNTLLEEWFFWAHFAKNPNRFTQSQTISPYLISASVARIPQPCCTKITAEW